MAASTDPSLRFVAAEDSPLPGNLAALWAADAPLAERVERALADAPYAAEPTKAGAPTAALPTPGGGRIYLHSRHQPLDEAKRLVDSADLADKTVFCVHGLGLGYHVRELMDRTGDEALVLVFEPDLRLVRTALEHGDFSKLISTGRLFILTDAERSTLMLRLAGQQALVCVGYAWVSHGPSVQLRPEFHRAAATAVEEFAAYCRTSINTLVLNGKRTSENIARNLGWYAAAGGIDDLKGRHAGEPAIIVSAGPSLRKNKHLLTEAAGKAVVVAVQTTLQPLLEMGVEPDYATSLDYHEICTRFFEKLPAGLRTRLVAEAKASSAVLSMYPGPMSLLGNGFADGLLREMESGKDRLRAGATVAHLAFYLAEYMGCDPIIFVGQDLGFGDGLAYTPGTGYEDVWRPELGRFCTVEMKQWEHVARERPILRRIPDQRGVPMYTEERLFSYLQQFERDFATTRARVIDATEGGALKRGAEVMPLAEALARFCANPLPEGRGAGATVARWDRLPEAAELLLRRDAEAERIEDVAGKTLELLIEVKENIEDQPRVNRLIAQIDALRAEMNALNDCYELVTQLGQQAEFLRFCSDRKIAASKASGTEKQRRQLERDVVNVRGIIDSAGEFRRLMRDVVGRLHAESAERRAGTGGGTPTNQEVAA